MTDLSPHESAASVTVWFDRLRDGDPDAAAALWARYFERLTAVARSHLQSRHRRVADEEDIAAEVLHALCRSAQHERLPSIESRDDLWRMLLCWTRHGVIEHVRRHTRQRRGGGNVRGDSIVEGGLDRFPAPSTQTLDDLSDGLSDLLGRLPDESLRTIARRRLAGYTNEEVAAELDVSTRTVERKLSLIRAAWSQPPCP